MRRASYPVIAGALILAGMVGSANATTVNVGVAAQWTSGSPNATELTPLLFTATSDPTYVMSTSGSVLPGGQKSPYFDNTDGLADTGKYSVLSPGTNAGGDGTSSSATYFFSGVTALKILWGSPDSYNHIDFYNSGGLISTLSGSDLSCYTGGTCVQDHWILLTFNTDDNTPFTKIVLRDDGTAAYEYVLQEPEHATNPAPLPAAVWLFGSVLAGGAGFGRWRKRKANKASLVSAVA